MKKNIFQIWLPLAFTITAVGFSIYYATQGKQDWLLDSIGLLFLGWLPTIIRFFKMKIPVILEAVYFIFIFLASVLGSSLDFYNIIPFWDIILHFSFGYIGCVIAMFLIVRYKISMPIALFIIFTILFSMGCGAVWELMEFTIDHLFNLDTQHRLDTGIYDTMEDLFANFGGSLLFALHYLADSIFFRKKFFTNIKKDLRSKKDLVNT